MKIMNILMNIYQNQVLIKRHTSIYIFHCIKKKTNIQRAKKEGLVNHHISFIVYFKYQKRIGEHKLQ